MFPYTMVEAILLEHQQMVQAVERNRWAQLAGPRPRLGRVLWAARSRRLEPPRPGDTAVRAGARPQHPRNCGSLCSSRVLATELAQEAAAYGLVDEDTQGWRETRIWCANCGQRMAMPDDPLPAPLPSGCSNAWSASAANWTYIDKSHSVNHGRADMEQALTPERLVSLLGGFPDKPPLDIKVLEAQEYATYQRRLIEYTTEGDERVQAFLLMPSHRAERLPGIVAIHQDGAHRPYEFGKSEPAGVAGDPELAYGLELCLRGYVVICPDRFPFESRSLARSRFKEQFDEFRIFTEQGLELTEDLYAGCVANRLLFEEGRALPGKHLFELLRAVDCLREQQEVDTGRIGAIGHSAGGFLTALLMYVDPRVKVGCASCGTFLYRGALNKDRLRPINGFGGFAVPGLRRWGDMDDVRAGLAPRPFLETTNPESDQEMAELTGKARACYAALGVPERYQYVTYEARHIFRKDMREMSYAWFDRWLRAQGDLACAR